ncbi:MAG: phage holin family protein [Candidatus Staskawiczbacteria bacterium]|nr:phage holin family protein [Candidatus Staskawiczbacteria bacterium]
MKKVLSQIIAASLGIWIAVLFIPEIKISVLSDSNFFGIPLTLQWQIILLLGITLGLINFFVKPVISVVALPLRIITLGLFGIAINMAMIWILDFIFKEITIPWFWPLLWTTIIISFSNIIISKFIIKED